MSFPGVATQFTMIDTLHFSPVEMTISMGIVSSPWTLKPIFGFISDKFEIFNWGRRRPYIAFSGLVGAFMYTQMKHYMTSKTGFITALTVISACICIADVCADSITVEHVKMEHIKGNLQSSCWIARASGTLLGALFGGLAYNQLGAVAVFQIVAIMPLLMSMLVWKLPRHVDHSEQLMRTFCMNFMQKMPLVMIFFCINLAPDYSVLYSYFLKAKLGYNPQQFAWLGVSSSTTFLLSMIVYKRCFIGKRASMTIIIGIFGSTIFRATQLFVVSYTLPYFWLVLFDGVAESFFGQLIMMPLIVKAAESCDDGVEGSIYALLMSMSNLSSIIGDWLGGILGAMFDVTETSFDNLGGVMVMSIILNFFVPFLVILKSSSVFSKRTPDYMPEMSVNTPVTSVSMRDWSENTPVTSVNMQGWSANRQDSSDYMPGTSANRQDSSDYTPGTSASMRDSSGCTPGTSANRQDSSDFRHRCV